MKKYILMSLVLSGLLYAGPEEQFTQAWEEAGAAVNDATQGDLAGAAEHGGNAVNAVAQGAGEVVDGAVESAGDRANQVGETVNDTINQAGAGADQTATDVQGAIDEGVAKVTGAADAAGLTPPEVTNSKIENQTNVENMNTLG